MPTFVCSTCGVQFAETSAPPARCPICEDARQYIGWNGQQWTTVQDLCRDHHNVIRAEDPSIIGIGTEPKFAIGQRALLIQTPAGNFGWDCVSLIDDATIAAIKSLGGLTGIAISHPHFYSSMVEWSQAFNGIPIYLHASDRQWVMRPDPAIVFWEGPTYSLKEGLTLIRCGGHFSGSTVLHWAAGADGRGALCTSDTLYVVADRRHVSFMWSYPNYIPLTASAIQQILKAIEPFQYDRIYGGWWGAIIQQEAQEAVARSAKRYLQILGGEWKE